MIATEYYATRRDGVVLNRTYSTDGKKIRQNETGALYDDAIDVDGAETTYTETDIPVDISGATEDKAEAYDILMGVEQ